MNKTKKKKGSAKKTIKQKFHTNRNRIKKCGGRSKIVLFEEGDKAIITNMINTYGPMLTSSNPTSDIKKNLTRLVEQLSTTNNSNSTSATNEPPPKKFTEEQLYIKMNYELYPFLFLVIDNILNITNPSKIQQKHKLLALKTIRKIELLKTPAWVDVMYNFFKNVMGSASDIANFESILDYTAEMQNIEDQGKKGARVFMDIYNDVSDDRKIKNPQCNQNNKDKIVDYRIKHYNADPIQSANHALNSIFYENYLKNKLGKNSNSKGIPITTQIDDILLSNLNSDNATGIVKDKKEDIGSSKKDGNDDEEEE